MPLYSYIARDKQGNVKKGEINKDSEKELAHWLYGQGFILTKFEERDPKKKQRGLRKTLARLTTISALEKVLFTRYLEVMLRSGLSLVKALAILAEQTENKRLKKIILELRGHVEKGATLHDSLAKYPHVFSKLYVSLVKTGEVSGKLDDILDQLAVQLKKDRDLVKKVTGAMIYPALVFAAMIGVGLIMMLFILPRLVAIFEDFDTQLPLPTRILIAVSKFTQSYILWILGGAGLLAFLLFRFMRSQTGRRLCHRLYLRIPVFGKVVKKFNIARFVRNFGSLLSSGMPILQALEIVGDALGNICYQKAVKSSGDDVQKGLSLGKILSKTPHLFPPLVTQVIEVGEETGRLDDLLERLAGFYEEDVDQTMKNISTIIEPVIMLVMGGAVGAMAVAVILPIYSVTSAI